MPPNGAAEPFHSAPRIAIVGGGLSGMAAAHAMASADLDIHLFEARRRPGGRTGSFRDSGSEQEVDYCQHVAMGCCRQFRRLLEESGLISDWSVYDSIRFLDPEGNVSIFAADAWLPAPLHLARSLFTARFVPLGDRFRIARTIVRLLWMPLEATLRWPSFEQFLDEQGQTPVAKRRFWKVIIESALGAPLDAVAVAPAQKVFVDGFAAAHDSFHLYVPRRPLSELFGDSFPEHLRRQGVRVHCGAQVRGLEAEEKGVRLHVGTGSELFDKVLVATAWRQLAHLEGLQDVLPQARLDAIARFPPSAIAGIHLWTDRPLTPHPHVVFVDRLVQWLFSGCLERSPVSGEHYSQVVISHSAQIDEASGLIGRICEELRQAFPAAADFRLVRYKIVNDRQAIFVADNAVEAARPPARTSHPDIFLAGDYTATGWPATMEGAVRSGFTAASMVLEELAQPAGQMRQRGAVD